VALQPAAQITAARHNNLNFLRIRFFLLQLPKNAGFCVFKAFVYVFGWSTTWCPEGKPLANRLTMVQSRILSLASRRWTANGNLIAAHFATTFSSKTRGGFTRGEVVKLISIALDAGFRLRSGFADKVVYHGDRARNFGARHRLRQASLGVMNTSRLMN